MTKKECPPDYFAHLCRVVQSVFAAESELYNRGVLYAGAQMSAEEYYERVAEEMINPTTLEELQKCL